MTDCGQNSCSLWAKRAIVALTVSSMLAVAMVQPAFAGMIGVDEIAAANNSANARIRLLSLIDRPQVRAELVRQGISPDEAITRVSALSDAEIDTLSGKLEKLPAGGSDVLGVLLIVFIVLLITDILGYTKIFSFTKPIK